MLTEELHLALRIIRDTFGSSASEICRSLLLQQECTLHELLQVTQLRFAVLQNCLIMLIHFDVVSCFGGVICDVMQSSEILKSSKTLRSGRREECEQIKPRDEWQCGIESGGTVSEELEKSLYNCNHSMQNCSKGSLLSYNFVSDSGKNLLFESSLKYKSSKKYNQQAYNEMEEKCKYCMRKFNVGYHHKLHSDLEELEITIPTKYSANIKNILYRLRFAHFANLIENIYGYCARVICVQFFKFHKLKLWLLINAALHDPYNSVKEIEKICDESKMDIYEEKILNEETIRQTFLKLYRDDIILRCKPLYRIRTRNSNCTCIKYDCNDEQHHITNFDSTDIVLNQFDVQRSTVDIADMENEVFCLNLSALNFLLCKKVAEDFLVHRMSKVFLAGDMLKLFLSRISIDAGKKILTQELSYDEIEIAMKDGLVELKKENKKNVNILRLLEFLIKHPDKLVQEKTINNVSYYYLSWGKLKELAKMKIITNFITVRCGNLCCRVWSFLAENLDNGLMSENQNASILDDQTISNKVLSDLNSVRKSLYLLSRNKFAKANENDSMIGFKTSGNAKHTILFSVNIEQAYEEICRNAYKICLNFYDRQIAENCKVFQLYCRSASSCLNSLEEKELRCHETAEDILEAKLLQIQTTLLVLSDF